MEKEFWLNVWQGGVLGFHRNEYHPKLIQNLKKIKLPENARSFVPLCGKSLDMIYLLSLGQKVSAIEICPIAVNSFFEENNIHFNKSQKENLTLFHNDELNIYCGDYFELEKSSLGQIDFVYDRASNIALPPDMRKKYYKKMAELTNEGTQFLILNFEHSSDTYQGPPFAVFPEEIEKEYGQYFDLEFEILDSWQQEIKGERFNSQGISKGDYKAIKITRMK